MNYQGPSSRHGSRAAVLTINPSALLRRHSKGMELRGLLKLSSAIDWVNEKFGVVANWLVLLACVISAGNAMSRYLFSESSNGWLEVQWYMFAGMVLLGGPYTLKMNEHVRVDLVYGMVSERTRIWI